MSHKKAQMKNTEGPKENFLGLCAFCVLPLRLFVAKTL
jgi:hypothetical protein